LALQQSLAQQIVPGEILVKIDPDADRTALWPQLARLSNAPLLGASAVASSWHIYKVSLAPTACKGREEAIMAAIQKHPQVALAQWNHTVQDRTTEPNDPLWLEQRSMRLVGLARAWDHTTGGLTPNGDTIVVAVLETGLQKEHPDLWPNLWRNHKEIPDNGIDDDNNGYVDDFLGWDAVSGIGDGNGLATSHGTSVCGIIGAKGDDGFGVTGVNWNIKVMTLNYHMDYESTIIAAYEYAAQARKRYNETQGKEGAFVVATNASFGIDTAMASDYQVWCSLYDLLGQVGVLSAGATTNRSYDVDEKGDMPTSCPSEYLISVTNLDAVTGRKIESSGYGATSIDMGAPGAGTYTTINKTVNGAATIYHGTFGGTSAATPHVAGTIGLLYSAPCPNFTADALTDPAACARRVRDQILLNLRPEPTLQDITVFEGRLDVDLAMDNIIENCAGTVGKLEIYEILPNPTQEKITIKYQAPDFEKNYVLRIFNSMGQLVHDETFAPPQYTAKIETISVQHWPAGLYFLQFGTEKDFRVKKFVKI
jgi:subtilisin family serine protease